MTPSSLEMAICVRRPESVAFGMLSGVTVVVLRMLHYVYPVDSVLADGGWRISDGVICACV